jgi:kynurenine formamidase
VNNRQTCAVVLLVACITMPTLYAEADDAAAADWYPSQWGAEDTLGAINRLSPELVLEAARLIRTGKTYSLGVETGPDTPAYPPRQYSMTILQPGDGTGEPVGENRATYNDDLMFTWLGIGSQIDGLGHIGIDHVYYNGLHARDFVTPQGLTRLGTHELPPIVTRGVLLDMTRLFGSNPVSEGTAFNRSQIDAAAEAQGVQLREGDVVLFHTGWLAVADSDPQRFMTGQPGLGVDGARYLADIGVVAIGADNWALEAIPFEDPRLAFPVHVELLAKQGIYILENMNTAELATDEAWEFMFVLGQPKFVGAVQVVINPIAIR